MGVDENLVDQVWGSSRPARPKEPVKVLGLEFTGKSFEEKLADLRKELTKKKSLGFVVCKYACRSVRNIAAESQATNQSRRHVGRGGLALQPPWKRVSVYPLMLMPVS